MNNPAQGHEKLHSIVKKFPNNEPKKVRWVPDEKLVTVRYFRLTDAPDSKEPSKEETTVRTPKVVNIPKQFQESRIKDCQMEKLTMRRLREKEMKINDKLKAMKSDIEWNQPLELILDIESPEVTDEEKKQLQRETKVFAVYYTKESLIPENPPELETECFSEPIDGQTFELKLSRELEEKREKALDQAKVHQADTTSNIKPDMALTLSLLEKFMKNHGDQNQWRKESSIRPINYKTVPCKMYHGPNAHCVKGEFCHFIHDPNFAGRDIPTDLWRSSPFIPRPRFGQELIPDMSANWRPNIYSGQPMNGQLTQPMNCIGGYENHHNGFYMPKQSPY